ncbi:hypothetical protein JKY72_05605 [Candidatus Gracilibacteria bacterium]|nr:hypothetical protein [Candidatus Gracilibacteria bacterium]
MVERNGQGLEIEVVLGEVIKLKDPRDVVGLKEALLTVSAVKPYVEGDPGISMAARVEYLKEVGFDFAAAYIENPILEDELTLKDHVAIYRAASDDRAELPIVLSDGRSVGDRAEAKEFSKRTLQVLFAHFSTDGEPVGPVLPEEIYIMEDIYRQDLARGEGIVPIQTYEEFHGNRDRSYNPREATYLFAGLHLVMPAPEGFEVNDPHPFIVLHQIDQLDESEELSSYAKDIVEKTLAFDNHNYAVYNDMAVVNRFVDEELGRKLAQELKYDLKGYRPFTSRNMAKHSDDCVQTPVHEMHGQIIKDDILYVGNLFASGLLRDLENWVFTACRRIANRDTCERLGRNRFDSMWNSIRSCYSDEQAFEETINRTVARIEAGKPGSAIAYQGSKNMEDLGRAYIKTKYGIE